MSQIPDGNGAIKRAGGGPFDLPGLSEFKIRSLMQGTIESFYIDNLRKYSTIEVERGVIPESLKIDKSNVEDANAYPITVKLRHLSEMKATSSQAQGSTVEDAMYRSNVVEDDTEEILQKSREHSDAAEIVHAKYVIGCDGGRSWTRQQIGCQLEGDSTDYIFGVVDIVPISDFRKFI
jgi:phenol 2-monooxygenase (NADPH)